MAANMEMLGISIGDNSKTDDFKYFTPVNSDAEIMVKEILDDIFDTAIRKSEEGQEKKLRKNTAAETGDLIDLTRNYKEEFRTILQNLKYQCHGTLPTRNTTLEDQIKKVIDEIKSLETSVRLNIDEGRSDIDSPDKKTNTVDDKAEIIDFHIANRNKVKFTTENTSEEVVLRVIDLQDDDGSEKTTSFYGFPSEEELVDVCLSDDNEEERPRSIMSFEHSNTGESSIKKSIANMISTGKCAIDGNNRKKRNIGQRIWHYIRKSSKTASCHSITRKSNTNN